MKGLNETLKKLWLRTPKKNVERIRYRLFKKYRVRVSKYWEEWNNEFETREEEERRQGITS